MKRKGVASLKKRFGIKATFFLSLILSFLKSTKYLFSLQTKQQVLKITANNHNLHG